MAGIEQPGTISLGLGKRELMREYVTLAERFSFNPGEKTRPAEFSSLKLVFLTI